MPEKDSGTDPNTKGKSMKKTTATLLLALALALIPTTKASAYCPYDGVRWVFAENAKDLKEANAEGNALKTLAATPAFGLASLFGGSMMTVIETFGLIVTVPHNLLTPGSCRDAEKAPASRTPTK